MLSSWVNFSSTLSSILSLLLNGCFLKALWLEATQYWSGYRIENDVVFGQVDFDKLVLNLVTGRGHSTFEILTLRLFLKLFSLKIFLVLLSDEQSTGDTHEQQFVREVASNDTEEEL